MTEFFQALANPDIPFLRYALIVGVLSIGAFGIIGTYVVVRRISYMAGAIAHSVLGGIGLGVSYLYDFPSGATIILFAGVVYLLIALVRYLLRKKAFRNKV